MKERFEYFLNAVHYCLYLGEIWSNRIMEKGFSKILYGLSRVFSFERFYERAMKRYRNDNGLDEYMYGKNYGQSIGLTHHWFGLFYSGYSAFLSFVLLGFVFKVCGKTDYLIIVLTVLIPIGLCYIPAYKAVLSKDRYLKFFKQFEKESEQWHKKWRRTTIAFCIGAVITALSGIIAMWIILLL